VFVTGRPLKPWLVFASKAEVYLNLVLHYKVDSWPNPQKLDSAGKA